MKEEKAGKQNKEEIKYDAFISYRHTQPDMFVAQLLHRELENFRVPKHIKKKLGPQDKSRITRVFRDKDELPLTADLAEPIMKAISLSEYLIVICSPRLPESLWCCKEIQSFISLHGREKVFAVLIEGEPAQSFPSELLFREEKTLQEDGSVIITKVPAEPLAADVRGRNNRERKKKLKEEMLRLLAPMFGCNYDELKQRHRERKIRRMIAGAAVISTVGIIFGSISTAMALKIHKQSAQIERQSAQIEIQYEESLKANAKLQADEAFRLLQEGDRIRAVETARNALTGGDAFKSEEEIEYPYVPSAEYALCESLGVYYDGWTIVPEFLLKHDTNIVWIKVSPDQKTILAVDEAKEIYLWDAENGKNLCKLKEYTNRANVDTEGITFLDEKRIAILANKGIDIIDLKGQKMGRIEVSDESRWYWAGLLGDSKGDYFLYILPEQVIVYDSQSYTELYRIDVKEGMLFTHEAAIASEEGIIALSMESEDMTYKSIDTEDKEGNPAMAYLVDLKNGTIINECALGYEWVEKLFVAEGKLYAISNSDIEKAIKEDGTESGLFAYAHGRLTCCDLQNAGEVKWYYEDESALCDVNVSRTSESDTVMLHTGNEIVAIHGTDGSFIDRMPYESKIVTIDVIEETANFTAYTESGRQIYLYMTKEGLNALELEGKFQNHADEIRQIAFAVEGRILVLPQRSNSITVMNSLMGKEYEHFAEGVSTDDNCIDADSLEEHLLFVSADKLSLLCMKEDGTKVWRKEVQEPITAVMFFGETSSYVVMQQENRITVFGKHTGEEITSYKLDAGQYDIRLEGAYVEVKDSLAVQCYETVTGELIYEKDLSEICAVGDVTDALNWNAGYIVVGSVEDGMLRLYDAEQLNVLGEMELNTPFIDSLFLVAGTAYGQQLDMELYVSYKDGKLEHYYFHIGSGFRLLDTFHEFEYPVQEIADGLFVNREAAYEMREGEVTAKIPGLLASTHSYYYIAGTKNVIWRVPVYSVDMLLKEAEELLDLE